MNKRFRADVEKSLLRIPINLDKETNDWLYNLSTSMKMHGGYKLPKSYIIRSLINAFMRLKLSLKDVKTSEELNARVLQAIAELKK